MENCRSNAVSRWVLSLQRLGRMVRQGNRNSEVTLYRYVTTGTFDAYSYQTLEAKQKFISQVITSKDVSRTCEDVDRQALSYSEIKALCTGDERCKELMQLTDEVRELASMEKEHRNTHYELENKLAEYPQQRQRLLSDIQSLEQDLSVVRSLPIDYDTEKPKFSITIGDVTYTDRTEAGKALDVACNKTFKKMFSKGESVTIGSIYGFPITAECKKDALTGIVYVQATIHGAAKHTVDFGASAPHNLKKIEGVFTAMEKKLSQAQDHLTQIDVDIEETQRLLAIPFGREDELRSKTERVNDLRDRLQREAQAQGCKKQRTYYFSMAKTKAIQPPEETQAPKPPTLDKKKESSIGEDGNNGLE